MITLITVLLILVAVGLFVPAFVLFLECTLAAALARRPSRERTAIRRPTVAVLVPAHNEEPVIEGTILSLRPQLAPTDRLIVIADNCTDGTATVARAAGATVIARDDPPRRGKGYALEYGVRYLSREPPEVVVFVDADCTLHPGALERLSRQAAASVRPIQARNMVVPPAGAGPLHSLSAFAFLIKNVVRPSGLARVGLPCPLMGTGMAFPWSTINTAPLATGALAEDLQLGSDLALAGHPPMYCFEALVTSPLATHWRASETQRRRWEYGHLATLVSRGPRLLRAAVLHLHLDLLALALDLCVPPLSLLMLVWVGALVAAVTAGVLGASWVPTILLGIVGSLVFLSITEAWISFGRRAFPLSTLLIVPFYIFKKIPMYVGFLGRRKRDWVRTEREPGSQNEDR